MEEIVQEIYKRAIWSISYSSGIHGTDHWEEVHTNGLMLAHQPGADLLVIRLFAYLHDCKRLDDGRDEFHGQRAADFVEHLYTNKELNITQEQFFKLYTACKYHHTGAISDDITIGSCYDADRLELTRCGIRPNPDLMSTPLGKRMAIKMNQI